MGDFRLGSLFKLQGRKQISYPFIECILGQCGFQLQIKMPAQPRRFSAMRDAFSVVIKARDWTDAHERV